MFVLFLIIQDLFLEVVVEEEDPLLAMVTSQRRRRVYWI
jgi:hypothetical protein